MNVCKGWLDRDRLVIVLSLRNVIGRSLEIQPLHYTTIMSHIEAKCPENFEKQERKVLAGQTNGIHQNGKSRHSKIFSSYR